jgi:phosphoribosyl 1,2-cyclic phosphodiesterase
MRHCSLGSGSQGNALLVERPLDGRLVLLDCGLSPRELRRRMRTRGAELEAIAAIVVTHEHGDHLGHAPALARALDVPLYCSAGTFAALDADDALALAAGSGRWCAVADGACIDLGGGLTACAFSVPHDAREPLQFRFEAAGGAQRLGVVTDLGHVTPHVVEQLSGCQALVLECNHDRRMLSEGPYPPVLKSRVGGDWGHLSNDQAAGLLSKLLHADLRCVTAAHLSLQNNRPELALEALQRVCGAGTQVQLSAASQHEGFGWRSLAP